LTKHQKKEFKKTKIFTYARRNKTLVPSPQAPIHPPPEKKAPSQPRKEVPP
jgi:hypothetical protein